jgi:hypothetical protein
MALTAAAIVTINTGQAELRLREPADGSTTTGYIYERNGKAVATVVLDLYMDAPDMNVPLVTHDLHSKPVTATLDGSVGFLADGRISIAASNLDDVNVPIAMTAVGIPGAATMLLPSGYLNLQLLSPPSRGAAR